jgi:DNA-binding CsgD family transcriptional regulator
VIPLVVVEGEGDELAAARRELEWAGWRMVDGWETASPARTGPVVRAGTMRSSSDAVDALLAALAGDGVLVAACAGRELIDRLCDDLRRLGPVDHRLGGRPAPPALSPEQVELLRLLGEGASLGDTARRLNVSRRTADRRIASARRTLGVNTTAEAVRRAARSTSGPSPQHGAPPR